MSRTSCIRGASDAQLAAAKSAQDSISAYERRQQLMADSVKTFQLVATAALAAAVAFATTAKSNIDFADSLKDLSQTTGIAVEDLTGLKLLAEQNGSTLEGLSGAILKMSVNIGKTPDKFKELGVTATDTMGQFKQLADIFNQLPDINQRNALAAAVFSKSWKEIGAVLKQGSVGIAETVERGSKLAGVTKEMVDQSDQFNDKLAELKITSAALGLALLPTLNDIVTQLVAAKEGATGFVDAFLRFFSISNEQAKNPTRALFDVEERLQRLKDEAAAIEAGGGLWNMVTKGFTLGGLKQDIAELERAQKILANLAPKDMGPPKPPPSAAQTGANAARVAEFLKTEKEARDKANAERKAQLEYDLEQIRAKAADEIGIFRNTQTVENALRAAGLTEDQEHYANVKNFIESVAAAEKKRYDDEIARRRDQKFTGDSATVDRIKNEEEINKLIRARDATARDATAAVKANAIAETAALNQTRAAYEALELAAQEYYDTVVREQQRELAGIGKGTQAREQAARLAAIEERTAQQINAINARRSQAAGNAGEAGLGPAAQKRFDDEIALARKSATELLELEKATFQKRLELQSDWVNGATEAMANYISEAKNVSAQVENLFTSAFKSMEDALVDFVQHGTFDFKKLADSIIADIIRIQVKAATSQLMQEHGGGLLEFFKGMFGGGGAAQVPQEMGYADGTDYVPATGMYQLHQGEAVIPADENANRGVTVNVVNRGEPLSVTQSQTRMDGGQMVVDVLVDRLNRDAGLRNTLRSSLSAPA